ncbi:MAG: PqqD family protein [Nitrospirota bacterium]
MEIAATNSYKAPDNYSWRDVNNELVVLNLQSGEYFTFNDVGRLIWLSVNDGKPVGDITRLVVEQYATTEDKAQNDVTAFISNLLTEGLLIPN